MTALIHPQVRPYLAWEADPTNPRCFRVADLLGLSTPLRLTAEEAAWLDLLDGTHSLAELPGPRDRLAYFVRRLEDNLFLDGPRFRQVVENPVRPPRCIGCYEGDPGRLRHQLECLFTDARGPGLPSGPRANVAHRDRRRLRAQPVGSLRAALIPHIDYPRGGVTYAWGFKEVVEQTDANLFVIIGTSHYSRHRYTLTRKDFETPLGIVPTDQNYIDRLVAHYGTGLFDDEWLAHLPEHSIELEVVFLQYLYEGKRPLRIVPLVVGPFFDCIAGGDSPASSPDIARMATALRRVEAETLEPICYIISGDLAHIGPKFQDPHPLTPARLRYSRQQDLAILRQAAIVQPANYFQIIADENDARNICGLSPTVTFLEAIRPGRGKLLHYDQYIDPKGQESVSFASMAFYDE